MFRSRPRALAILANSGWLLAEHSVRILLGIFVAAWVARYLGPSEFGELAYALAIVGFLGPVASLGLDTLVVRDLAARPADAGTILGTALRMRLAAGCLCWAFGLWLVAMLHAEDGRAFVMVLLIGAQLVFGAVSVIKLFFQARLRSRLAVRASVATAVAVAVIKVAAILSAQPVVVFAGLVAIEALLHAAALVLVYRLQGERSPWSWSTTRAVGYLRESWPLIAAGLAILIYMRIDQVMLRHMLGPESVGLYAAAVMFSNAAYALPVLLVNSAAPAIANLKENQPAHYLPRLQELGDHLVVLSAVVVAGTIIASPYAIPLLFGPAFLPSILVAQIHILTLLPVALGVAQTLWLVNERRTIMALERAVLGAVVNVGLNLMLIPIYGVAGAALASVMAQTFAAIIYNAVRAPVIFRMQFYSLTMRRYWQNRGIRNQAGG